jgi:hypothetical protein
MALASLDDRGRRRALYTHGAEAWRRMIMAGAASAESAADIAAWERLAALPEQWPVPEFPLGGRDALCTWTGDRGTPRRDRGGVDRRRLRTGCGRAPRPPCIAGSRFHLNVRAFCSRKPYPFRKLMKRKADLLARGARAYMPSTLDATLYGARRLRICG